MLRVTLVALALGLAPPCPGAADLRAEPEVQPAHVEPVAAKARRLAMDDIPVVALDSPSEQTRLAAMRVPAPGLPLQVGFARAIAALDDANAVDAAIDWRHAPGGEWIGAVAVASPGASALRLGLRVAALPQGALLRFHAIGREEAFEVRAEEIAAAVDRNLLAGESEDAALTWWSPAVESDAIVMEVELPPGAAPSQVRIAAPLLSHLLARPSTGFAMPKAAASCEIDAMCHQDAWANESSAVARILYTKGGSSFVCSGTLLADKDPGTVIPYFLTANHCIPTQAAATSVQSFWFYRSTACDSGQRGAFQTRTGGATLLYASATTDTALLRFAQDPPAGAGYAGWIVGSLPPAAAAMTAIHHPSGDLQKITFGNLQSYWVCTPGADEQFSCNPSSSGTGTFFTVGWSQGITEAGSSGSGVFLDNGHYLVGQLYGGTDACGGSGNRDWYGRFDLAYNAGLYAWLGMAPSAGAAFTPAFDYSDLWWNPAESGWGLSITQHPSTIFAAWYVYDALGRPSWLALPSGTWTSATRFTGDLYATTGPDPRGAFDANAVTRTRVGTGTFSFSAADRARLDYTVNGVSGSRPIERQLFGPVAPALAANYGGLWWNAAESGWGVSITQQYQTIFAVWYAYAGGQPTWYVLPGGAWISGDTYSGAVYRTTAAPGSFYASAFDPAAVTRTLAGTMSLRFANADSAVMSWTIDGASGSKAITRQAF
jgi:hypothetical protein